MQLSDAVWNLVDMQARLQVRLDLNKRVNKKYRATLSVHDVQAQQLHEQIQALEMAIQALIPEVNHAA
ncbi:hypothetical protein [Myxococcus phage Mx1]|nr:hypothetical protein [Myxococcus phage Mx1]